MATYQERRRFRVGGSGFTAFQWDGQTIAFARGVSHTAPQPVAQPVAIQPLDARYPLEIITPAALGPGQLQIEIFEMYNTRIWDEMIRVATGDANVVLDDLVQVFIALSALNRPINCVKIINPPKLQNAQGEAAAGLYGDMFHNCMITNVDDGEQIQIGTMEVVKNITITYTRKTRINDGVNGAGLQGTLWNDPLLYNTYGY